MVQVELCDVVAAAELANVAWQREAGLVIVEVDLAPLRLHADELERELACAHRDSLLNSLLVYVWFNTRTAELVFEEIENLQVREVADGLRDGACARALEFCVCLDIHRSEANQQTYPIGHSTRDRASRGSPAARAQAGSRLGAKGTCEESSAIGFFFV